MILLEHHWGLASGLLGVYAGHASVATVYGHLCTFRCFHLDDPAGLGVCCSWLQVFSLCGGWVCGCTDAGRICCTVCGLRALGKGVSVHAVWADSLLVRWDCWQKSTVADATLHTVLLASRLDAVDVAKLS